MIKKHFSIPFQIRIKEQTHHIYISYKFPYSKFHDNMKINKPTHTIDGKIKFEYQITNFLSQKKPSSKGEKHMKTQEPTTNHL